MSCKRKTSSRNRYATLRGWIARLATIHDIITNLPNHHAAIGERAHASIGHPVKIEGVTAKHPQIPIGRRREYQVGFDCPTLADTSLSIAVDYAQCSVIMPATLNCGMPARQADAVVAIVHHGMVAGAAVLFVPQRGNSVRLPYCRNPVGGDGR